MKKIFSVIIIMIILIAIAGIWIIRNNEKNEILTQPNNQLEDYNSDFDFDVTSRIDIEKLKSYNLPIILDFGSDGCIPCREMAPDLKNLNQELKGKAIIKFIDVWKYPSIAEGYPVDLIPTQILINSDGTPYKPQTAGRIYLQTVENENGKHIFTVHVGILTITEMKSLLKGMGLNE